MKELSIEQKAKRYDEAIRESSKIINHCAGGANIPECVSVKATIEQIFPELKESEDERIRKALIDWFSDKHAADDFRGIAWERIVGWLEKQGEQKPADKVEPKFKVGDWVANTVGNTNQVVKVLDDGYTLDDNTFLSNSWVTKHYHLWTIQDAKDGDVIYLPNGNNEYYFFIFKGIENETVMSFAYFYQYNDGTYEVGTTDNLSSVNDVFQPSTKEQRNLLFSKMKEAGYVWDADKKELKKIEHTPKHKVGDTIYYNSFGDVKSMVVTNVTTDSTDNPMYEDENGNIVFEEDLIEYNTAWSEEDEERIKNILSVLDEMCWNGATGKQGKPYQKEINWLKSIKDRVLSKPAEWSEEDNQYLCGLIGLIEQSKAELPINLKGKAADNCINWLKSLKDRYTWKPSDEQMATFWDAICTLNHDDYKWITDIKLLYQDLKKLKE